MNKGGSMNYREFIIDYDTLLNMPVTQELICLQITKILLDERVVGKKGNDRLTYCYKINDLLKVENLFNNNGFKLVSTLKSYSVFIRNFVNDLLKDNKYRSNADVAERNKWYSYVQVVIDGQFHLSLESNDNNGEDFYLTIVCSEGLELSDLPISVRG
jgi:hypothetical protein